MPNAAERATCLPVSTVWHAPLDCDPAEIPFIGDLDPLFRRKMVETQVLLGEPVTVVEEYKDWSRICAPWQPSRKDSRGYPGWIPSRDLASVCPPEPQFAVVTARRAELVEQQGSACALFAPWATILPVREILGTTVRVMLPGGTQATLNRDACVIRDSAYLSSFDIKAEELLVTAMTMLGIPHVLGGMTEAALDCSGLVHLACRVLGVQLPREAHDIAGAGNAVPIENAAEGDFYVFREPEKPIHHIGIVVSPPGTVLHTPGGGVTTIEQLDSDRLRTLMDVVTRLCS